MEDTVVQNEVSYTYGPDMTPKLFYNVLRLTFGKSYDNFLKGGYSLISLLH